MRVDDLMSRNVITVQPDTPLQEVARLLVQHRIGGVPVVDSDGILLGVVSETDFAVKELGTDQIHDSRLNRLLGRPNRDFERVAATTAGEAMTQPAITIDGATASVREAVALMVERNINRLPVTESGRLTGILTRGDIVRMFAQPDDAIGDRLRHALRAVDGLAVTGVDEGVVTLAGTVATRAMADTAVRIAEMAQGVISVRRAGLYSRDE